MTFDHAEKIGYKLFPDGTWRRKTVDKHILKNGAPRYYVCWYKAHKRICYQCGKEFLNTSPSRKLRCSRQCIPKKTGIYKRKNGYIEIRFPGGKSPRGEHRIVMERFLGRNLQSSEYIHHKNHNRSDNRIENLQIVSLSEHNRIHKPEECVGWKRNKKGQFK